MAKDNEQRAHNKGQEDYKRSHGKEYKEPHGNIGTIFGGEKEAKEDKAYREGWRHAREQDRKR